MSNVQVANAPCSWGVIENVGGERGGDPVEGLQRHADRIWHVHFKDHDPAVAARTRREQFGGVEAVGQGIFCELGKGDIDFPAVLAKLRELGYGGWIVVEQDILPGMGSPKESAQRNREYLRTIGLQQHCGGKCRGNQWLSCDTNG